MNKVWTPVFHITRSGGSVSEKVAWDPWYSSGVWLKRNYKDPENEDRSAKNEHETQQKLFGIHLSIHPHRITV